MIRYLSVCSGIEAASVAWEPLGWTPAGFAEIEPFPRAVLEHRQNAAAVDWDHRFAPRRNSVPLFGDFTQIEEHHVGPIDLLVGGTPCQDYSIAGLRAGLAGNRGNLTLEFARLADRTRPRWLVWENVPGVFSTNNGRDFGAVLASFSGRHGSVFAPPADGWRNSGIVEPAGPGCYGLAWRVLDAQYFGVAQRRRRVFIVGYLGDWRRAAAVLLERASLSGHPAPRRQAGTGTAIGTLGGTSPGGGWRFGADEAAAGHLIPQAFGGNNTAGPINVATALSSHGGPHGRLDFESETFIAHALRGEGFDASEDGTGRGTPLVPVAIPLQEVGKRTGISTDDPRAGIGIGNDGDPMFTLQAGAQHGVVAFDTTQITSAANYSNPKSGDPCHPLAAGPHPPAIAFPAEMSATQCASAEELSPALSVKHTTAVSAATAVRRLTPRECERLQGFPDDYTLVPHRGKPAADGPRYKALGNSMAVPVMRWIGERIALVDALDTEGRGA